MNQRQFKVNVLRAKEASQYLGIGLSTFWRWVAEGRIPRGVKLSPRCTVWKLEILDKFLEDMGV